MIRYRDHYYRAVFLSKTEQRILDQMRQDPTHQFSVPKAWGYGYGHKSPGVREYAAAKRLADKGFATVLLHETKKKPNLDARDTYFTTISIQLKDEHLI